MAESNLKRILVVDDEINVCKSVRQALKNSDYEIELALSGVDALRLEGEKPFDVILLDLMMPVAGGLDVLKTLKARNIRAQIIIMTGYPSSRTSLQSMQLGAFDYLPKPFLLSEIRSLVAKALAAGQAEK
jgi:two-component system, OmpR family, phosphate regulon sensor histidine kinase PhoR